jgi:hypothetical protein
MVWYHGVVRFVQAYLTASVTKSLLKTIRRTKFLHNIHQASLIPHICDTATICNLSSKIYQSLPRDGRVFGQ